VTGRDTGHTAPPDEPLKFSAFQLGTALAS
jgi:hypothetical protein